MLLHCSVGWLSRGKVLLTVVVVVVVVVIRPIPRDGGMVEDHGAPEAAQLPKAWTGDCKERERERERERDSRQRVSGANSL